MGVVETSKNFYNDLIEDNDKINNVRVHKKWCEDDLNILRKYYGKIPVSELKLMLKDKRSNDAIKSKAYMIGLSKWNNRGPDAFTNIKQRQEKAGYL
jgi:hypothetical protein